MKYFRTTSLIFNIILLFACNNDIKNKEDEKLKIETYLDSLQNKFKGFEQNSVVREELNSYLKVNFNKEINNNILNDLPLKLEKVEKCGNNYILHLNHSLTNKYYNRATLKDIELELYAETDEKTAKSVIEGKYYLTDVEFKEYITYKNNEKYCALVLMSPFMGYFYDEIQFGAIGVTLNKIDNLTKKNKTK
jgi:hypothetical protein